MLKPIYLQLVLSTLALSGPVPGGKREISDARHASGYSGYAMPVTATLGSGRFSPLGYPGSIGNLYTATDDDFGYEYPRYAGGYGGYYEPYTSDARGYNLFDDDALNNGDYYGYRSGFGGYGGGFGSYGGYGGLGGYGGYGGFGSGYGYRDGYPYGGGLLGRRPGYYRGY